MKNVLIICVTCVLLAACGGGSPEPTSLAIISDGAIAGDLKPIALAQLEELHRIAASHGWTDYSRRYTLRIVPHDQACEDPISFLLPPKAVTPGTEYDGSDYDKDPLPGIVQICAAGRYFESSGVIQVTEIGIRTSDVVRYEAEHQLLRQVDRDLYLKTLVHAAGAGHPILQYKQ